MIVMSIPSVRCAAQYRVGWRWRHLWVTGLTRHHHCILWLQTGCIADSWSELGCRLGFLKRREDKCGLWGVCFICRAHFDYWRLRTCLALTLCLVCHCRKRCTSFDIERRGSTHTGLWHFKRRWVHDCVSSILLLIAGDILPELLCDWASSWRVALR